MKDKFPEIYKRKVEKLKSKIQTDFYYHANDEKKNDQQKENLKNKEENNKIDRKTLIEKIDNIFKRPNYVYQADVIIMLKSGENIERKIVGFKENFLITLDGEKIYIDEVNDIK